MPKKEHIHIVTDFAHKNLLIQLGEKYGSMTKAFEYAIEAFNKIENRNSCIDCKIKFEYEQNKKMAELLNTITLTYDNIQDLLNYLKGNCTIQEVLIKAREKATEFVNTYIPYIKESYQNNYESLLVATEEWKRQTRLFKYIQVDRFKSQIIAKINIFEEFPIFVAAGLIGYLEALNLTFDFDIIDQNIFLKWFPPEKYLVEKSQIEQKFLRYVNEADELIQPFIIRKGFIPVTPGIFEWMIKSVLNYEMIPIDLSYQFIRKAFGDSFDPPTSPEFWVNTSIRFLKLLHYATQIKSEINNEKNSFKLSMICRTPELAVFILEQMIVILAKYGWKLMRHRLEFKQLVVTFQYVGDDDPSILEPLYRQRFVAYLNQRFQKLRVIPLDEYEDLARTVYNLDRNKFIEIFRNQGRKFGNAIKLLAKNNLQRIRAISLSVIPQLLKLTSREKDKLNIIAEYNKLTLIFKTMDDLEMTLIPSIIIGVMESLNYSNIIPKYKENIVTIEFQRPQEIIVSPTELSASD
ncbi:MAG: hypothetical protein ACTSRS_10725 [Candidatus Helarchaeota archaeon]